MQEAQERDQVINDLKQILEIAELRLEIAKTLKEMNEINGETVIAEMTTQK